jgi:hypothetical protein
MAGFLCRLQFGAKSDYGAPEGLAGLVWVFDFCTETPGCSLLKSISGEFFLGLKSRLHAQAKKSRKTSGFSHKPIDGPKYEDQ